MFTSRCVFSRALAASAVLIFFAVNVLIPNRSSYKDLISLIALIELEDITFVTDCRDVFGSPGLILSGL